MHALNERRSCLNNVYLNKYKTMINVNFIIVYTCAMHCARVRVCVHSALYSIAHVIYADVGQHMRSITSR